MLYTSDLKGLLCIHVLGAREVNYNLHVYTILLPKYVMIVVSSDIHTHKLCHTCTGKEWNYKYTHAGPHLDLSCVRLSNAANFCKNYATLYFDAKHLEKGIE